jgi:DNA repair protein RadD
MRVLLLVHVRELVQQDVNAILSVWPDAPIGIFSAGLKRRDSHQPITFASIQSVYRRAADLGRRDLVLIDEAHLVPRSGNGMYRTLLEGLRKHTPDLRVAGLTATTYRTDTGRLDEGEDRLFDKTVYSYGIGNGIADKWLSPLVSKASRTEVDVRNVARRGGEFVASELETAADKIIAQAVEEIVGMGRERRSWLCFCAGVKNAFKTRDAIRAHGISCETVTGKTPLPERDRILGQFKAGEVRCLTNVQVLTTGFDAPQVDMLAMLRPTLSTSLYVQMVGRATRLAPEKKNALILDFSGNVRRHGPVDDVSVLPKRSGGKEGKVDVDSINAKECPECQFLVPCGVMTCHVCGYEWPRKEQKPKHEARAESSLGILSTERTPPVMVPVVNWRFARHQKAGSHDSVRVTYIAGLAQFNEWLAFEHGGYARSKAERWWNQHSGVTPPPWTVTEALARAGELVMPATISVRANGRFFDIVARSFSGQAKGRAA